MNAHQPDEFLPWLARALSHGGLWQCDRVRCRADGSLGLSLRRASREVGVVWRLDDAGSTPGGAIELEVAGSVAPDEAEPLLSHLRLRVALLLERGTPPLLRRRDAGPPAIVLDPELLRSVRELLDPGETCCGPYTFVGVEHDGEGLRLLFRAPQGELALHLRSAERPGGSRVVAQIGPLVLQATSLRGAAAEAVAHYVAFVLRRRIAEGALLTRRAIAAAGAEARLREESSFLDERYTDEMLAFETLFDAGDDVSCVTELERECLHCIPNVCGPIEASRRAGSEVPPSVGFRRQFRSTAPTDTQVVLSDGEERFTSLAAEQAERSPRLLVAFSSCLSRMLGDDTERAAARIHAATGVPTIYLDGSVSSNDNYPLVWRRLLEQFPSAVERSAEPSVNLIGFGHRRTRAVPELTATLAAAGVEVNLSILPSFDPRTLPRLGAAWLNVVCPSKRALRGFRLAAEGCLAPVFRPAAPCGFRGTLRWIDEVRRGCGLGPLTPEQAEALTGAEGPAWEALRAQARGHRVGVVLRLAELAPAAARLNRGIAWFDALDEMGFGLDLLVVAGEHERAEAERAGRGLLGATADAARHRVRWVGEGSDALALALREGEFSLVHSDRYRDRRVTTAGKVPFSIADFELGFEGSRRSLERLVHACRLPFYARYRAHLDDRAAPHA